MTVSLRSMLAISAVTLLSASIAGAQSNPSPTSNQQPASTTGSNESSRPATTTLYGDTGLWYKAGTNYLVNMPLAR